MMRFIFLFCISSGLMAWNAKIHQWIGRQALENVKPQTRLEILKTFQTYHTDVDAVSVWMDVERFQNKSHYINMPYGQGYYFPQHLPSENALIAIDSATQVLKNQKSSEKEKILALRVLFHVTADIHQPMHTINFYSKRYPEGDKGGNLYVLPYHSIFRNLHHFWDMAGGLKLPQGSLACHADMTSPILWVQDSFLLAAHVAYFPPRSRKKWQKYQRKAQGISHQQIQKAACHLAAYLDEIYFNSKA